MQNNISALYIKFAILLCSLSMFSGCGSSSQQQQNVKQTGKQVFLTSQIADMKTAVPVSITLASGLSEGTTWSVTDGKLPTGSSKPGPSTNCATGTGSSTLCLEANGGTLYGTPTVAGDFTFKLKAKGIFTNVSSVNTYSISVRDPIKIVNTQDLKSWKLNQAGYVETFTATGGRGQYTWSTNTWSKDNVTTAQTSLSPVPGLTLNAATGVLSGTPTTAGQFSFIVQAADSANVQEQAVLLVNLFVSTGNLAITTNTLTSAKAGINYVGQTMQASGGREPFTWSIGAGGGVPPSLILSASGVLTAKSNLVPGPNGIVIAFAFGESEAGVYKFPIQVEDAENNIVSKVFSLTIDPLDSTGTSGSSGGINFKDSSGNALSFLDFGPVFNTNSQKKTVTITNNTGASVSMKTISTTNSAFSALPVPFTLANGDSINLDVSFNPTTSSQYAASLDLTDTKANKYTLALSGKGSKVNVVLDDPQSGTVTYFDTIATSSLPVSSRPVGFIPATAATFQITDVVGTNPVKVHVTFSTLPASPLFYKIINNTWVQLTPDSISGNTITYSIVDKGPLDSDSTVGTILDPIVVGTSSNTSGTSGAGTNIPPVPSGGGESSGGCFIATAAYGSYLDPHVMVLRHFRDNVLLKSELGSAFVQFYYKHSPPVADFIAQHDMLRMFFRLALTPLIYSVEYPFALVLFFAVTTVWFIRRRLSSKEQTEMV